MSGDPTRLRLSPARRFRDALNLAAIDDPSGIRYLDARDCGLTDIDGIDCFDNLRVFRGDRNQIRDIGPFAGMRALTGLYLGTNRIEDVTPLAATVAARGKAKEDIPHG